MYFDWHTWLGIGASILLLALIVPYVKSIVSSTTRPSIVSWFGWAFLFAIDTVAQASKGFDWSLTVPLIGTISTAIIAVVALRLGRAVWTRTDRFSIALGILAIALWAITQEPLTALVLSIIADLAITLPTIVKTYQDSTSEPPLLWALYTIASALTIVATTNLTVYNLLVPLYSVFISAIITALALRKLPILPKDIK
jgi:hypothetical protein